MKNFTIRPIPNYMAKRIRELDLEEYPEQVGFTRYYAYFTMKNKQLCKVTVALKNRKRRWAMKQVAVHFIHEKYGFCRDIEYFWLGGFVVGWYEEGFSTYRKTWEDGKWYCIDDKYFDPGATIVNIEFLARFPEYKYAQYNSPYIYNMFKYLRLYEQFPQMEYIMKMGLQRYVLSKMILRQCSTDKTFCKWLYKNKERLTAFNKFYDVSVVLKAYKSRKNIDALQKEKEIVKKYSKDERLKQIRQYFRGELPRLAEYIVSHNTNESSYRDYFVACEYLKIDMTIPKNRYPKDFKRWHDIRIDEFDTAKLKEDQKRRKEFYKQFLNIANKYISLQKENDDYCVIIAKSPADLVHEGKILHHCVGRMGYDQKFAREETLIFFIRLSATPDIPLVTVEYSPKSHKILQCYGEKDTKPNENILHYVNKVWLPYANRKIKKIAA